MRRSVSVTIFLMLVSLPSLLPAQNPWATLSEPPNGTAPQGDVLSAGLLGREIGTVELMIHFYHDLLLEISHGCGIDTGIAGGDGIPAI
jgi:hypothetical protein